MLVLWLLVLISVVSGVTPTVPTVTSASFTISQCTQGTVVGTVQATNSPTSFSISDPTDFSISAGGQITLATTIAPGTYTPTVTATNSVGTSTPVTVTITATGCPAATPGPCPTLVPGQATMCVSAGPISVGPNDVIFFTSQNFPREYVQSDTTDCTLQFVSTLPQARIQFTNEYFHIKEGYDAGSCDHDYLSFDGMKYCDGSSDPLPIPLVTTGSSVTVAQHHAYLKSENNPYQFAFMSADSGEHHGMCSASATIRITLTGPPEFAPISSFSIIRCTAGTPVGMVTAVDDPTYSISDPAHFSISPLGVITLVDAIPPGTYTPTVTATNTGGSTSLQVTLTAACTVFTPPFSFSTSQCTAGTSVGSVSASTFPTYSITASIPLVITVTGGDITLGAVVTPGTYSATVSALSSFGTGSASVTITVVCAPAPVFSSTPYSFTTSQCTEGTSVGKVTASGSPTGYTISDAAHFSISPTGDITLATAVTSGTHNPMVTATNAGGSTSATIQIKVTCPPVFISSPSTFSIRQCTAETSVGSVSANNNPIYTISNPARFSISSSGAIALVRATPSGTHQLTVTATNAGGSTSLQLSVVAACTKHPVFTSSSYAFSTRQCTAGTSVGKVTATGSPTYRISDTARFSISSSGAITLATGLGAGTYRAAVKATNAGGAVSATVSITVACAPTTPMPRPTLLPGQATMCVDAGPLSVGPSDVIFFTSQHYQRGYIQSATTPCTLQFVSTLPQAKIQAPLISFKIVAVPYVPLLQFTNEHFHNTEGWCDDDYMYLSFDGMSYCDCSSGPLPITLISTGTSVTVVQQRAYRKSGSSPYSYGFAFLVTLVY
ncbi:uncharacterized protein LOC129582464 [Paramacrobiotus metropolitanus]|uniref:uncharacterized protein LOC129582464 n=1 Tax=Paramacrobiotus metropolitanus TaxID=2943436 RepID=UPI002445683F|nr:uncharacterized protein LOC129582464 [Paramacrobiotus metropolitanus]